MKKTILIIDDDYFIRTLLCILLKEQYEVVPFENGLKAMLWLDNGNIPDLVLSDVDMPQFDGITLLNKLRKSGYYRNLPIMMLTGYIDPAIKEKCMLAGATAFITKPFNPPDLLNRLDQMVQEASSLEIFSPQKKLIAV